MAGNENTGARRRVLFIDDDEVITMLTALTLQRAGYVVSAFSDPRAALDTFRRDPAAFDVVVSDIQLGSTSGFALAAEMLQLRPCQPILLTSGMIVAQDRQRALEAGVRAVLPKARVMTELGAAIEQLLAVGAQDAS